MEKDDSEPVYYYMPPIQNFSDTGYTEHVFGDGAKIKVQVVPSDSYDVGADLQLTITDEEGNVVTELVLDKYAGLCIAHAMIEELLKQENILYGQREALSGRASHPSKGMGSQTRDN